MHSTRRSATPIRVQQFWDAIDRCSTGTQGPVDFERIMTIVTSMHKVPRDELNRELEAAIRDELIVSDVMQSQKREETEIYKLPEQEMTKPDHDWYCFHCHLGAGGPVVACEDCPRIFHLDCLPDDRKPDKDLFVCPPCHIMATKPSAELLNLKAKQLNQLLEYSCRRFKDWGIPQLNSADGETWALAGHREAKDEWRYDLLVYFNIDLSQMLEKAVGSKYQSLEEFQVDCETLFHGIGVYFGVEQLKGQAIAASFHKEVVHDIQEIKLCHDCFRRSNEKHEMGPWWFCLPCTTPHEVVWAKQSGYPYWPAKIMKVDGSKYDVRYFGGNYERGMIDVKNIQPIDTPLTSLKIRKTAAWNEAYEELTQFLDIAKNPEKINSLPATKAGKHVTPATKTKSKGTTGKRAASSNVEEVVTKKSRNEVAARKSLPARPPPRTSTTTTSNRGRKSAGAQLNNTAPAASSTNVVHANGVAPSPKKKATSATIARRDSNRSPASVPTVSARTRLSNDTSLPEVLDQDDLTFLNSLDDTAGDDTLSGDIYFSDEEQDELHEKVSEDAVSSSVNETRGSRNAYTQVNIKGQAAGQIEALRERFLKHLTAVKEKHGLEISANKKKQWCYNCEREAIYHCCWNTAYCSIDCQQLHWSREHKRLCRRKKATSN